MKLDAPVNPNYAATVVRAKMLRPLTNCDNLVGIPLFGLQAIVSKDTQAGDMGVVFPAECQLSIPYACANNLYRHSELNADKDKVGYFEDNRRVRAIKLRGNRSDALFMPLSSLNIGEAPFDPALLKEGDTFDTINGVEICRKYVRPQRGSMARGPVGKKQPARVDERLFPQHFDSVHWQRICQAVPDDAHVVITQKLHGTSIRVGNVSVRRKLSLLERLARRVGIKVQESEYAMVYGSRKVVKDADNPNQQHFYEEDLWSVEGRKLAGTVPQGYIVYGEIVGWTDGGASIQKHYTYDCLPGTRKLYVYRVSFVNEQGVVADLSWDALKEFCWNTGLLHVAELWRGPKYRLNNDNDPTFQFAGPLVDRFLDTNFVKDGYVKAVPLSPDSPCDEGVCIRVESIIPEIYKHKSPAFLQHETKMLDKDEADIEADQEVVAA